MSNVPFNWRCLRCGLCCINTVADTPICKAGVFLMPEECKLFPDIIVKPLYGIGLKGNARPRPQVIYAYQMIASPCPHYNAEEHSCRIRDYRPLTCRSFPIEMSLIHNVLHRECTAVREMIPEGAGIRLSDLRGLDDEIKATKRINTYFKLIHIFNVHRVDTRYTWFYDFEHKNWLLPTDKQLLEALHKT